MKERPTGIPTDTQIATLTSHARIAYAARCARRAQPLLVSAWADNPKEYISDIDTAILLSEQFASKSRDSFAGELTHASLISHSIQKAIDGTEGNNAPNETRAVPLAALSAIHAAINAYPNHLQDIPGIPDNTPNATRAGISASDAVSNYAADVSERHADAVQRDYTLLLTAQSREDWADDTPVPPEFFGPLWPDGVPEGWPRDQAEDPANTADEPPYIVIEVEVDDDADDAAIEAELKRLTGAMSELHQSHGGSGLKIDAVKVFTPANSEVPA